MAVAAGCLPSIFSIIPAKFFKRLLGRWIGVDWPGLEVGQLHAMQPSLHAAARVSEMPQGEVADVPDAVLDNSVAFKIGAGFDELTQFLLQLRRQQGRPARALPIPQTIDALGIVARHPVTQCLPIHAGLTSCLLSVGPVQSHRKGQKTTQNPRITFFTSQSPKLSGVQVSADWQRCHGDCSR